MQEQILDKGSSSSVSYLKFIADTPDRTDLPVGVILDLLPQTITLVDHLSDTLILDTTSIRVVNTKTGEVVTNWTSSVEGQTLKIVLPDNLPLTVTYETTVNAAPGQTISISNNAHWKGYTTPSGGSVEVKEFHYSSGGTAGADTSPSVTVKKLDQYNTSQTLSGATFTLVD